MPSTAKIKRIVAPTLSIGALFLAGTIVPGHVPCCTAGTSYTTSAHGNTTSGVNNPDVTGYGIGNCGHCHDMHASRAGTVMSTATPLVFASEEAFCDRCHDGSVPSLKNIKAQILKQSAHPIDPNNTYSPGYSGRHTLSKLEAGHNGEPFRGTNRHAECADCHDPHTVSSFTSPDTNPFSTSTHNYLAGDAANNNKASGVLRGAWGVEPSSEPTWGSAGVGFQEKIPIDKEYQLCFKCHSYYALQEPSGVTSMTGPSGQKVTDQAMEFSTNNRSVHPVRVTLNAQTGSLTPRALDPTQIDPPWDTNVGNQTMYCSDCHGADDESTGGAVGPHGSTGKYLLKGPRTDWPVNANNPYHVPWSLQDINRVFSGVLGQVNKNNSLDDVKARLFCLNCHKKTFGGYSEAVPCQSDPSTWTPNHPHKRHLSNGVNYKPVGATAYNNRYCVACHVVVPHGSKRSRLIVYGPDSTFGTDSAPYQYIADEPTNIGSGTNVNWAVVGGWVKPSLGLTGYVTSFKYVQLSYCWVPTAIPCNSPHPNNNGASGRNYETDP